jgi:hypothetical protein
MRQDSLFTTVRRRSELGLNPGLRLEKRKRKFTNYVMGIVFVVFVTYQMLLG